MSVLYSIEQARMSRKNILIDRIRVLHQRSFPELAEKWIIDLQKMSQTNETTSADVCENNFL
jgi:hypothetical protein